MQDKFRRPLMSAAAVLGLLPLAAQAIVAVPVTVLDFEGDSLTGLYLPGESLTLSGFTLTATDDYGVVDNAASLGAVAPTGNATQFYFNANAGRVVITRNDGQLFSLGGFSAAFVPLDPPSAQQTVLVAQGLTGDGKTVTAAVSHWWSFADSSTSHYPFASYNDPAAFSALSGLSQVSFYACAWNGSLACDEPLQNNGQFALDDLQFTLAPVPEPATALLLALGLAGVGLRRRRAG